MVIYVRAALGGVAAMYVALLISVFENFRNERATGLGAIAGGIFRKSFLTAVLGLSCFVLCVVPRSRRAQPQTLEGPSILDPDLCRLGDRLRTHCTVHLRMDAP